MQAPPGERAAALAETSKAIAVLDGMAADVTGGTFSSLRGQVYMRAARELYARSLENWQDTQKRGILTAEDAAKLQEVARELARCDASLRQLAD